MKLFQRLLSSIALLILAACGGGGGSAGNPTFGGGSGSGGGTALAPVLTIELSLVDAAGAVSSNILAGSPLRARAVLRRNGEVVPNEIIQFSVDQGADLVRIDPTSGSQLTDASGLAVVTVSSLGTSSGAGRIRVNATVGTISATNTTNFFASGGTTTLPPTLTLSGLEIGSAAVSAYGTTGLRVRVLQAGVPYTAGPVSVNFTSSCPTSRATVTPTATTTPDGYAVATFVDNGCAQTADTTVTLTASIATDTKSGSMIVRSPTTGSLRFLSVVPSDKSITLRGQGGNGRQENATVTFRLVDVAGSGVGDADVCFDSSTYIGGLNIDGFGPGKLPTLPGSAALCGSDSLSVIRYVKRTNPDGTVSVQVNSGTVPTPVRVRARAIYPLTGGVALESFSDTLSVSTGLPLQRSFSLSVDKANIDGGNFDGEVATLTVRMADQFSNPVPDGTVVNFIGSGASVCTSDNGSCRTTNGACSCNVVSQARRPVDRRVVITAYAVGLEDFDDRNGDNVYTVGTDPFYDLGDAYVDSNKDGLSNSATVNSDTDILIPYQNPSLFTAAGDGTRGTAHIRASTIIYLSQSSSLGDPTVVVPLSSLQQENSLTGGPGSAYFVRLRPICPTGSPVPQATMAMYLDDGIGNPMASTTSLSAADVSTNIATGGFRPASVLAIGARSPNPSADLPNLPKITPWSPTTTNVIATPHSITVRGVEDKCSGDASFALQVTSPRGGAASARILYEGEPRSVGRGAFNVRYRDLVTFTARAGGSRRVDVSGLSFVSPAGVTGTPTVSIDCGGNGGTFAFTPGSTTAGACTGYASGGLVTLTYTVTAGGSAASSTAMVTVTP